MPYENLPLGAGLKNRKNYEPLEKSTGEAFTCYLDSLKNKAQAENPQQKSMTNDSKIV